MSTRLDSVLQKRPDRADGIRLLASRDPSGNLKYLDWGTKMLASGQALAPEIADILELFHKFKGQAPNPVPHGARHNRRAPRSEQIHPKETTTMKQRLTETHTLDQNGNPAGGNTSSNGIAINWQDGPLGRGTDRAEPNGAFVEGVIQAAIGRLEFYQKANYGKFACPENADAITYLETALLRLEKRTRDREEREVEGTHTP